MSNNTAPTTNAPVAAAPSRPHIVATAQSRAVGSVFFAGFGAFWIGYGLLLLHRMNLWVGIGGGLYLLGLVFLIAAIFYKTRGEERAPDDPRREKAFNRINGIQWGVVVTGVVVLSLLHGQAFIMTMIASVVGLHLFPLASVLRQPFHYVTATLILLWAVGCLVLAPRAFLPGVTGLGTGMILWFSATVSLTGALRLLARGTMPSRASLGRTA